jgi:TonB family protein
LLCALALPIVGTCLLGDDKGRCPSSSPSEWVAPSKPVARTKPPFDDAEYVGEVRVRFVISDKGYVCIAQLTQSLNQQADAKALAAVQRWRFTPTMQADHAVPALSNVSFFYWRDAQGHVVATHAITPLSSLP